MNDPHVSILTHNIDMLSRFDSLEDVRKYCVADCTGTWLFEKKTYTGIFYRALFVPLQFLGVASADKQVSTVLKTVEIALCCLLQYSSDPTIPLDSSLEPLTGQLFYYHVRTCVRKVYRLFYHEEPVCFRAVLQANAPTIVRCIGGCPVPWDVFSSIMRKEPLSSLAKQDLAFWIESVSHWGRLISPSLYFFLFAQAARRCFPVDSPPGTHTRATFLLAWKLFQAGLTVLEKPWFGSENLQEVAFDRSDGDIPFHVGRELAISFPRDFPLRAFEVVEKKEHMVLASPSLLLLGMLQHNMLECESLIPYITSYYFDPLGRFVVVERLVDSLGSFAWHEKHNFQEKELFKECSQLIARLLTLAQTPQLDAFHFFVAAGGRLCLLSPLRKGHSYFCLPDIERFIKEIAQGDVNRIRLILTASKFREHPVARVYVDLLKQHGLNISPAIVQRTLELHNVRSDPVESEVNDWVSSIQRAADRVSQHLKVSPRFCTRDVGDLDRLIIKAILALQLELGFCSVLPEDLHELIIAQLDTK